MKRIALFAGACSLLLLWSCNTGHHHEDGHDHDLHHSEEVHGHEGEDPHGHDAAHGHEEEGHAGHSDEIVIDPAKAEAAGIVAETVEPSDFSGVIRTGGQILPAIGDEKNIVATSDGIVSFSGNYFEGSGINEAEPLFSILSGNIQDGNRIGKAKIAYETARAEYERASELVDSRIVSEKEYIRIKEAYENARMAYEALKPNADGSGVQIEAPFDGYIRDIFVNEGDFVTMGTPLACMIRKGKLILRADVSQRHYDKVGRITSANFAVQYGNRTYNTSDLGGRLLSVGRSSAENAYYIPVTFEFNSTENVIPGSFAEIWLLTGRRGNVLSVPVSAITEEQGLYFVYLKLDESCYRKQEVTLGESDGIRTEILSGLESGDNVVVRGAYNVKLASASNIIPAHSHNH